MPLQNDQPPCTVLVEDQHPRLFKLVITANSHYEAELSDPPSPPRQLSPIHVLWTNRPAWLRQKRPLQTHTPRLSEPCPTEFGNGAHGVHGIHLVCVYRPIGDDSISLLIDFVFSRLEPRDTTGMEQSLVVDIIQSHRLESPLDCLGTRTTQVLTWYKRYGGQQSHKATMASSNIFG